MIRFFISLIFISIFWSCKNAPKVETIEVKNDDGIVTEMITRRVDDFAKEGLCKKFDSKGVLQEQALYSNDTLHGKQDFFYPNGQVQETFHYKNGVHHGEYKLFFEDGKVSQEATYKDGKWDGELNVYHATGQLKEKIFYVENIEMGPFVEYHENGKLATEGNYKGYDSDLNRPLEDGELKKYDKNGEHYQTMNCVVGRCSTTWLKEGVTLEEE